MNTRWRLPLLLFIATIALGALPFEARRAPSGRPVVLVVHGRGYLQRDSADFRRQALHALRQGAFKAAGDSLLRDDDVRIVWYADLLDRRQRDGQVSSSCENGGQVSILQAFAMIASELIDTNADSLQDDARSLAGDLRFFGNVGTRCAAERRVGEALARASTEGRPVILVGHSLGAMVAWGHLQHRTGAALPEVRNFITVGSPLGSRGLRELLLGDSTSLTLPKSVRAWVNVVNANDPFAARLTGLDSLSGQVRSIAGVADVVMEQGDDDAHEVRAYLRSRETARAVIGAWCEVERIRACSANSEKH